MSVSMTVTAEVLAQHNLTAEEYDRIVGALGREPNRTELGLFSVMWSEHCSYKSSKKHLRTLPTSGPRVVQGPGENAGAVDIGDGLAAVFKIESHNHPSFIEPYQGAATGVGGILRDIFTMGARPIAVLNSLRFGPPDDPKSRRILEGVVAGIGGYGNSFGCPTVGGEVVFDDCYRENPLVNALCLGIVKKKDIFLGRAEGVGNTVFYVGAKTGRDGIHGATMASAEFGEGSEERRPTVQVGDPFMEKVLLEACLEALKTGAVVGIQDMGAAGLTCSTSEMGARAGTGVQIDIDKVPKRETGMNAYEVMLSESQERMLLVAEKGREKEVIRVFEKWDLHAEAIGSVTADRRLRILDGGRLEADVPNEALTNEAPVYDRPWVEPENPAAREDVLALPPPADLEDALRRLLSSPSLANKRWIYRQYDSTVRTNTMVGPGSDAAVVRIKGTKQGPRPHDGRQRPLLLARPLRGSAPRRGRGLPQRGGGGGHAHRRHELPELRQPREAGGHGPARAGHRGHRRGLPRPRRAHHRRQRLALQRDRGQGHLPDADPRGRGPPGGRRIAPSTSWFKEEGDVVYLLGDTREDLGGQRARAGRSREGRGPPAAPRPHGREAPLRPGAGGRGRGLAPLRPRLLGRRPGGGARRVRFRGEEPGLGGRFDLPGTLRPDVLLFSESPSRMIVTTREEAHLRAAAHRRGVPCHRLGVVEGDSLALLSGSREFVSLPVAELHRAWMGLERLLAGRELG